jgi:hypothetical protein
MREFIKPSDRVFNAGTAHAVLAPGSISNDRSDEIAGAELADSAVSTVGEHARPPVAFDFAAWR